ncbi:MAG: hypothetical protein GY874_23720, partial [Desulfobacteraceae bacterium]|nr:hypothetical protein [Desulfobacteraceae bacterium]
MQKYGGASVSSDTLALCTESFRSTNSPALNTYKHVLTKQDVFANTKGDKNDIYPPTVTEIAQTQKRDPKLKGLFKKDPKLIKDMSLKVIDETDIIVYKNKRLVIPDSMTDQVVQWYHHYLMHPGHTQLAETLKAAMYWKDMLSDVKRHVKHCKGCQKGKKCKLRYGKLRQDCRNHPLEMCVHRFSWSI